MTAPDRLDTSRTDTGTDRDPDAAPDQTPAPAGRNLMRNRAFAALMRSRWYPAVFQVPVAAVFGLVGYELLVGPDSAHHNPGTALMWVLWWPVLPVLFVVLGRFWCAVFNRRTNAAATSTPALKTPNPPSTNVRGRDTTAVSVSDEAIPGIELSSIPAIDPDGLADAGAALTPGIGPVPMPGIAGWGLTLAADGIPGIPGIPGIAGSMSVPEVA